jgi:LPS sulfotransferase NodH
MNASRFDSIVKDLPVDDAAFRDNMERLTPADCSYVIFFSARSGSTWLTSILSGTGRLGYPEEYLNPNFVRGVAQAQNTRDPKGLLQMLKRRRKTPNGVFGIEVRHIDVELLNENVFFEVFDEKTFFFHLWRDNIVSQGVSLFRAVTTQRYHSTSDRGIATPPAYDTDAIRQWVRHVASTENRNVKILGRRKRQALSLRYEDIVQDRAGTIELFARTLHVPFEPGEFATQIQGEPSKIGDDWNLEAECRFRDEQPEFVAEIEAKRLMTPPSRPGLS